MFHEFIDSNHNIIGNQELEPEQSHSFNTDLSYEFPHLGLDLSLSGFYNHIDNMITFFIPAESNRPTSYINLLKFKTQALRLNGQWKHKNLSLSGGLAYTGRYQQLTAENTGMPAFVYGWEANFNPSFRLPETGLTIAAFYKFNGPFRDYRLVENDAESRPELQQIDGFHLADLTLTKKLGQWIQITCGIRNLLDVNTVNNNLSGGGAHSDNSGETSVGYGRSYFLRLNFKFQSNQ